MNSFILNFSVQVTIGFERIHLFVLTFHQFVCFFFMMDFVVRARQIHTQHSISRVDSERRIIFREKKKSKRKIGK